MACEFNVKSVWGEMLATSYGIGTSGLKCAPGVGLRSAPPFSEGRHAQVDWWKPSIDECCIGETCRKAGPKSREIGPCSLSGLRVKLLP